MPRHSVLDDIWIRGQVYSIKKIQKLYDRDKAIEPIMFSMINEGFQCPACGDLIEIGYPRQKFCAYCGQRLKWPRKNSKKGE